MWCDYFKEEIVKEASRQAKGKAEEIKKRRSENTSMNFSRRDAGGAGINRKAQQMALIENKATPFQGNNQPLASRNPANINGYQFNPIRNQYRRSMVTGQLGRPTPGVSNGIGNLSRMDVSSGTWDTNSSRARAGAGSVGEPRVEVMGTGRARARTRAGDDISDAELVVARARARAGAGMGAGAGAGIGAGAGAPSRGINPWLIGAGALGLGAGALGLGAEHFFGEDGPSHEEILQSAQTDRMNQIAQMNAERAAATGQYNPYVMGAAGLGAAGLGYGMSRRR